MNNACPNCGTVYNITPQLIGRSTTCKKCGAALVIDASGLQLAGGERPEGQFDFQPVKGGFGKGGFGNVLQFFKEDLPTWLFRVGVLIAIICLFFALLDKAKVDRRLAKVEAGDNKQRRLDEEFQRKFQNPEKGDKESFDSERKERDKARKNWQTIEKPKLQEEVDSARYSARTWGYWYTWGMMWGFLFLGYAALGYLAPEQATIRRIVGSIVLCGMTLFIFIRFVFIESVR